MSPVLAAIFLAIGPITSFVAGQTFQYPGVHSRITQPIDESQLTVLKGHVHPLARAEFDRGVVDDNMPVEHLIVLLQRSPEQRVLSATLLRYCRFEGFLAGKQV